MFPFAQSRSILHVLHRGIEPRPLQQSTSGHNHIITQQNRENSKFKQEFLYIFFHLRVLWEWLSTLSLNYMYCLSCLFRYYPHLPNLNYNCSSQDKAQLKCFILKRKTVFSYVYKLLPMWVIIFFYIKMYFIRGFPDLWSVCRRK